MRHAITKAMKLSQTAAKRILVIVLAIVNIFGPTTAIIVSAAERGNTPYENADVFVAECLLYGARRPDMEQGQGERTFYLPLKHNYTYREIAEDLVDKSYLSVNSVLWKKTKELLDADLVELFTLNNKALYETVLLEYLSEADNSTDFATETEKKITSFSLEIYDNLAESVQGLKSDIKDEFINKSVSIKEVNDFLNKYEYVDTISAFATAMKELNDIVTTYGDLIDNLSNLLVVYDTWKEKEAFLLELKKNTNDKDLKDAIDSITEKMKKSAAVLSFDEINDTQNKFMIKKTTQYFIDELVSDSALMKKAGLQDLNIILESIIIGRESLNLLFNSDEQSVDNIQMLIMYNIDTDIRNTLRNIQGEYTSGHTKENAFKLIGTYRFFIQFQIYASEWTKSFARDILMEGIGNFIWNKMSDGNNNTYSDIVDMLNTDIDISNKYLDSLEFFYDDYISWISDDNNSLDPNAGIEQNATELLTSSDADKIISFYKDYLSQTDEYGQYPRFCLLDVDGDEIPELITEPRGTDASREQSVSFVVYRYNPDTGDINKITDVLFGFMIYTLPDGPGFSSYSMDMVPIYRWQNGQLVNTEELDYKMPDIVELKQKYCNENAMVPMSEERADISIVFSNLDNMLMQYEPFSLLYEQTYIHID